MTPSQIRYRVEQAGFIPGTDDDTNDEWLVERAALAYADLIEKGRPTLWCMTHDADAVTQLPEEEICWRWAWNDGILGVAECHIESRLLVKEAE